MKPLKSHYVHTYSASGYTLDFFHWVTRAALNTPKAAWQGACADPMEQVQTFSGKPTNTYTNVGS